MMMKYNRPMNTIMMILMRMSDIWPSIKYAIVWNSTYDWISFRMFCRAIILNVFTIFLMI